MSLYITSLNSGSNGNCYYVGNDSEGILIDVGISCREVEKRMKRLGLAMEKVRALFVSHEHSDHIKGIAVLSKKYRLPVYITDDTPFKGAVSLEPELRVSFNTHNTVLIGELAIKAFRKRHDAADPHSFVVSCKGVQVGVFTDLGVPCNNLIYHFRECHAAFLEANYDEEMLERGRYPYHLKRRIRGGLGHLSNRQALNLFISHKPPFMSHLVLAHLSKDNNCPKLVKELFAHHADGAEIIVASRYEETGLYWISGSEADRIRPRIYTSEKISTQYTLF